MAKVPKAFHNLFWEVDAEKLDTDEYPEYIMERILEYGTLEGVKWMRRTFGDERIKAFIKGAGQRSLSLRTINFWQMILKLRPEECTKKFSMKSKYSFWEY
jgi:hypothetical protein